MWLTWVSQLNPFGNTVLEIHLLNTVFLVSQNACTHIILICSQLGLMIDRLTWVSPMEPTNILATLLGEQFRRIIIYSSYRASHCPKLQHAEPFPKGACGGQSQFCVFKNSPAKITYQVDIIFPSVHVISLGSLALKVTHNIWRQWHCQPDQAVPLSSKKGLKNEKVKQILWPLCYVHASFMCCKVCRVPLFAEQEGGDIEMKRSDMVLALTKSTFQWGRQACKNQL